MVILCLVLAVFIAVYVLINAERRREHCRKKHYEDYIRRREQQTPKPPKPR
jgi:hypothetical protein